MIRLSCFSKFSLVDQFFELIRNLFEESRNLAQTFIGRNAFLVLKFVQTFIYFEV